LKATDLEAASAGTIGSGQWTYRMVNDWARLPDGWSIGPDVAGVAVDPKDNVYVFARGAEHPLMVFDREGNFLRSWGEGGMFVRPHAVAFGADGYLYCTDDGTHTVRKFTPQGDLVLQIGVANEPAPRFSGKPFHRCTHTALSPQGDIYVSDGYGNARVHKYSPDGKLILSWGDFGTGPGEFNIPHNVTTDPDGWVYVADRENHRVQVFDGNGRFETEWHNLHRPCAICTEARSQPLSFIAEIGPQLPANRDFPRIGPRISIVDHQGGLVARLGDNGPGIDTGHFLAPHGIAVDSRYDIYVSELGALAWPLVYPDKPVPSRLPNLRKLVRVAQA
jgi:DNA-binding beta-propeller fold protein YncE